MHIYADFLSKAGSAFSFARYEQRMVRPVLPSAHNLATGKAAKSLRMLCLLYHEKQGGGEPGFMRVLETVENPCI